MKNNIFILSLFIFISCNSSNGTGSSQTCDSIHSGSWTITENGKYENSNCTGNRIQNGNCSSYQYNNQQECEENGSTWIFTTSEQTLILNEDCSYLVQDNSFCNASDEDYDVDFCSGDWSSNSTAITITSFFSVDYIFDNDEKTMMTSQLEVTQMAGTDDEYDECQYTTYTKE
tara:strand:- start:592 stop:1110 length:519 start_codon:yes stop_codon:yes gene_type:complete